VTLTGEAPPLLIHLLFFVSGLVIGECGALIYALCYIKKLLREKGIKV
jgi:hypothetical protein